MSNKAVFIDRDNTLIEDPGYLADPSAVKLLPGVELAIRSLHQSGFKIVIVTNQSGIARGLLTEETLEAIHGELRRKLGEKGVHLDGIYYCPFHPEGSVEQYTTESDMRKPRPGMLLKAAEDMDIDLAASWMIGDGARDVEAGQRAGCRTVRVRTKTKHPDDDENVQADYTVRNLVDAAKVILRSGPAKSASARVTPASGVRAEPASEPSAPERAETAMDDSKVRQEILRHVRQLVASQQSEDFSFTKLIAGIIQMIALLPLAMTIYKAMMEDVATATMWGTITVAIQVMALTFFLMQRPR